MSGDGAPFRAAGGCTGAGSSRGVRLTLLASNHQELLAEELPHGGELQIKRHQDSRESVSDSPWCTVGIESMHSSTVGLPMWGAMMVISKSFPGKVFAAGVVMLILATTFRTGSRGAMIAFLMMVLVLFLRASILRKMQIILAVVVFLGVVLTTMPGKLISRYKTTVNQEADDGEMDSEMLISAHSSTQRRKELLRHSLVLTMRHPLFGVGPGMFDVADDIYAKTLGAKKGSWLGTHNSYTQVSSEIGIPAFLFFVAAIWMALKGPYSVYQKTRGDPRLDEMGTIAMGLHYCLIIYAVTILFEHIAYTIMLPAFGGLAASMVRTAAVEIQRIQATPLPVSMSPAVFHSYLAARPKQGPVV